MTLEISDRHQEGETLFYLGLILGAKGDDVFSTIALHRSMKIWKALSHAAAESLVVAHLAQQAQRVGKLGFAVSLANKAWALARIHRLERDFIYAARAQGEASLGLNDFAAADERLHQAILRARLVNLVDEELTAVVAIAELRRRQKKLEVAREYLNEVWDLAERGPYPLLHADALNVLTQIERDEGNKTAAIEAATKAYQLAWCDGPPFAYHWGLEKAKQQLKELGAPEPEMPPFDKSKFEPMPEVEIDPDDEFHVGDSPEAVK